MGDSGTLRYRRAGRLWFGEREEERWSIVDPSDAVLEEALHRLRHSPDTVSPADRVRILLAAEAYHHLCCYPLADVAVSQLRDIRKAVRSG